MSRTPKISIICPVYKAASYIERCINSILLQTFHNWELLLIDDGSPDNSGKICDELAIKDIRIKVFHKNNEGVSATREFGMQQASGEYIIHIDPDDWIEQNMLEELYEFAKANDSDMVICDFFIEYSHKSIYQEQKPTSLQNKNVLLEMYMHLHGSCCNKLIRHETIKKYHVHFPKNISYCEDLIFITTLLQYNIKINYLNKAFYHYIQDENPNSLVKNINRERIINDTKIINIIENIIEEKKIIPPIIYKTYLGKGILERSFYDKCLNNKEYKYHFHELIPYIKYMKVSLYRKFLYYISCQGYYSVAFYIKNYISKIKKCL